MWEFKLPTEIAFGEGASDSLPERSARLGKRCLVVSDRYLASVPAVRALVDKIPGVGTFTGVDPNPSVDNVNALAERIRERNADVVVAVGGGSVIDCAKAAAAIAPRERANIEDFHTGGLELEEAGLPLLAVPTTAGTGSEVTPFAVLDDARKGVKAPLASPCLYPSQAVVDPVLTHSMPRAVTACTGLDALSHALEGYWSIHHQPICDTLAMEAARLVFSSLETACTEPGSAAARRDMSYAALLAGMAFQLPKNAIVHACSFPLSNRFHLPHGAACAFTLEFAIRLNAPGMHGRMEAMADHCGFDNTDAMAEAIHALKVLGDLPCTLQDAGIPENAIETLVDESFHPLIRNNPVEVKRNDLKRMYQELAS
jgi:alcohol dehydrogenase